MPKMLLALTWEGHHVAVKEGTHTGDTIQTRWNTFETVQKIYPKITHERLDHATQSLEESSEPDVDMSDRSAQYRS